jgi:hypothetical protein
MGLVGVVAVFFVIEIINQWADKSGSPNKLASALWWSPIVAFCMLLTIVVWAYHRRTRDYYDFVTKAPGPGIIKVQTFVRGVDLIPEQEGSVVSAEDWQHETKKQVKRAMRRWRVAKWVVLIFSRLVLFLWLIAVIRS